MEPQPMTNSDITTLGTGAITAFGVSALIVLTAIVTLTGAFFLYKWMTRKVFSHKGK